MTEDGGPSRPLATYRAMRDFGRTPEPAGGPAADSVHEGGRFVVQRHRARRLHYDLRLELDGVLVSWAVPKGPTLDPAARHLAVHVEDHPIEYRDFEGVIPAGEYGGGDVIVWDRGTWRPAPGVDPRAALAAGDLHFDLDGQKLAGRFVLVRRGRPGSGGKEQWLLLHKRDADAVDGWDPEDHPQSVKSGRTNDEVASQPDALWDPDLPAAGAEVRVGRSNGAGSGAADALAALDELGSGGRWSVGGHALRLGHLDTVLFPASGHHPAATKRDLVRYAVEAAPTLLDHVGGHAVELHRYPDGIEGAGTWQRTRPTPAPAFLASPASKDRALVLDDVAALAWAANRGAVELARRTTAAGDDAAGWAWLDLEPGPGAEFGVMLELARLCRAALAHLGLEGRLRTLGERGLQLWVPVAPELSVGECRAWADALARTIAATSPEMAVAGRRPRGGRDLVRVHGEQNTPGARLLVPYSPQAVPGALVSVPLAWHELDGSGSEPGHWTIATVPERLRREGDPLAVVVGLAQRLPGLA